MQRRQWITIGLILSGGTLTTLAVVSSFAWMRPWRAILTGAELTSPLGCDCGVDISFWQHPIVYGLGLVVSLLLVSIAVWLVFSLCISWKKTKHTLRQFSSLPTIPAVEQLWTTLRSQVLPVWWPLWLSPRLQIIQDTQPRAMSAGLIHPTVFCSSGVLQQLTESELGALITHELMHIKRFDQILFWLIRSWTSAFPAQLRDAIRIRLTEYIECQTDQEAAQVVGVPVVGSALLSVAAWGQSPTLSATAHFEGVVETRLHVLAGWLGIPSFPWKPAVVGSVWLVSLCVTALALFTRVNTVFATELRSPACLEVESVAVVNHALVLFCFEIPMSLLE